MRKLKKLLLFIIAAVMALPVTACKLDRPNKVDASVDYAEGVTVTDNGEVFKGTKEGKTRIKISYTDAGFGSDWLKVMATHFVAENPDYWMYLYGDVALTASLSSYFGTPETLSDIYMPLAHDWQTYALNGWLEDLSDVYSAVADPAKGDEAKTVYDKMLTMWQDYCYAFDGKEEKMYGYPWSLGITGIAYNGALFSRYGWNVPATVDELLELCEKIKTDTNGGVAPFVYPGNTGGYFDFMGMNMWMQYSGIDGLKNFMSFPSAEVFNPEREPAKGKMKMLETFDSIFDESHGNALSGSMSNGALEAQMSFLRGEAAMIINGSWLETEMIEDIPDGFSLRYMPFPAVADAKKDPETGEVIKVNYATNPDLMLIPKEAPEVEGAKKFLVFISRDDMLCYFTKYTSSLRPFDYSVESLADTLSDFGKDVVDIFETAESYFPIRMGQYKTKVKLQVWPIQQHYIKLIMNTDGLTPERACFNEYQQAQLKWQEWIK